MDYFLLSFVIIIYFWLCFSFDWKQFIVCFSFTLPHINRTRNAQRVHVQQVVMFVTTKKKKVHEKWTEKIKLLCLCEGKKFVYRDAIFYLISALLCSLFFFFGAISKYIQSLCYFHFFYIIFSLLLFSLSFDRLMHKFVSRFPLITSSFFLITGTPKPRTHDLSMNTDSLRWDIFIL